MSEKVLCLLIGFIIGIMLCAIADVLCAIADGEYSKETVKSGVTIINHKIFRIEKDN